MRGWTQQASLTGNSAIGSYLEEKQRDHEKDKAVPMNAREPTAGASARPGLRVDTTQNHR